MLDCRNRLSMSILWVLLRMLQEHAWHEGFCLEVDQGHLRDGLALLVDDAEQTLPLFFVHI